ncbi:hypothetical protein HYV86_05465 [Candidatus Woesearchaeota archaeon]|nr:hypothetical protein [Candidatus Woesearchaeota archaeon]
MKTWWNLGLVWIITIIAIPFTYAATGCFLESESAYYCQDLDETQAQQECEGIESCNLNDVFSPDSPCKSKSQCERILCKTTCTELFADQCSSGAIIESEQNAWCTPGCCRIHYNGGNVCTFLPNKGLCETEAATWQTSAFNYDSQMDRTSCENYCAPLRALSANPFEHLPSEEVSTTKETVNRKQEETKDESVSAIPLTQEEHNNITADSSNSIKKSKKTSSNVIIPLIVISLAGIAFFVFSRLRQKKIKSETLQPTSKTENEEETEDNNLKWSIPAQFPDPSFPTTKLPTPKQEREKEKTQLYFAFGTPQKKLSGPLKTLDRLVKTHQKKQTSSSQPNTFDQLRSLSKKKEQK